MASPLTKYVLFALGSYLALDTGFFFYAQREDFTRINEVRRQIKSGHFCASEHHMACVTEQYAKIDFRQPPDFTMMRSYFIFSLKDTLADSLNEETKIAETRDYHLGLVRTMTQALNTTSPFSLHFSHYSLVKANLQIAAYQLALEKEWLANDRSPASTDFDDLTSALQDLTNAIQSF
jgi:hypothetical protein